MADNSVTRDFPPGCGPDGRKTRTQRQQSRTSNFAVRNVESSEERQERVPAVVAPFRDRCKEIRRSNPRERRVDLKAFAELKDTIRRDAKTPGPVAGVEVGDEFAFRTELIFAGVHAKLQNGIDFTLVDGEPRATCVVAKVGHHDKMNHPETLVYRGEGGVKKKNKMPDQKMTSGNLALNNSIQIRNPVRVVRGVEKRDKKFVYVYDGLFHVVDCKRERAEEGNIVYNFKLQRLQGQEMIDWKKYSCIVNSR